MQAMPEIRFFHPRFGKCRLARKKTATRGRARALAVSSLVAQSVVYSEGSIKFMLIL